MTAIRYDFVQTGADAIESAFLRIGTAAERSERQVGEAFRGLSAGARRAANDTETALQRAAGRAAEAEKKAAAEGERARTRAATSAQREADRKAAAAQKAADREIAATRRAEEQKSREALREQDRRFREAQRYADRIVREEERAASQRAAVERRASEKIAAERRNTLSSVGSGIKGAAATGVAATGALFTGAVVAAARDQMRLQETAQRIAINSRQAGQQAVDAGQLRREFEATAIATPGVGAADVADAVQRFISLTGDMDTARRGQRVFATVASATGADVGDVAEAAASISQQFDVKGLEEMQEVLAALTFQGKSGAFELRDAAAQFQRLAASGGAFGVEKSVQGVKTLGGLTQIARTGTGSAEQATTAVENLFTNLKMKAPILQKQGVDVYRDGKVRDVRELIVESIAKVGGTDIAKKQAGLSSIFGEQGIRAINPLVSRYNDAFRAATGTDSQRQATAMAAIAAELEKAINAPGDWAEVVKDATAAQQQDSAQLTAAWEELKTKVGSEVVPELSRMIPKLTEAADGLTPFIEAAGLAAGAMGDMVGFLKSAGLIETKDKTHAERATEAATALKKFDKERGIGPLTAAQAAEREKLVNTFAAETAAAYQPAAQATKNMTAQEFAQRYAALNPTDGGEAKARSLAATLARDPADTLASNDFLQRIAGETGEQRDLRRTFQEQITAGKTVGGQEAGAAAGELQGELVALTGAARSFRQVLSTIEAANRPHILQGG